MRCLALLVLLAGCAAKTPPPQPLPPPAQCGGKPLTVHFYDVAQALSVLVDLPGGRHILIDAADKPDRSGCGYRCQEAQRHLVDGLLRDLHGDPISMMWVTHQHSDHLGGVIELVRTFKTEIYVDNGTDVNPQHGLVLATRGAVEGAGARVVVVDGEHREVPLAAEPDVTFSSVLRTPWTGQCGNQNNCSIALRIDYCASSLLFTGDAEGGAESQLDPLRPVTLWQVGHHGSDSSSTDTFLSKITPKYAVISSGHPYEGTNRSYCHPTERTVSRLTRRLGGPEAGRTIRAFTGKRCPDQSDADWQDIPAAATLFATARDGDIVLRTTGDGKFERLSGSPPVSLRIIAR